MAKSLFLHFFSVVICSTVNDTYVLDLQEIKQSELTKFKSTWISNDKFSSGFIRIENLYIFLTRIGHPLGLHSKKLSEFYKVLENLDIYTYSKKYIFFYDILTELTKFSIINSIIQSEKEELEEDIDLSKEEVIEQKAILFNEINKEVGLLKKHPKILKTNPYYKYKKYYSQHNIDKAKSSDTTDLYIRSQHRFAALKLSKFVRCYKSMREKVEKLIEQNFYHEYFIVNYSKSYLYKIKKFSVKNNMYVNSLALGRRITENALEEEEGYMDDYESSSLVEGDDICSDIKNIRNSKKNTKKNISKRDRSINEKSSISISNNSSMSNSSNSNRNKNKNNKIETTNNIQEIEEESKSSIESKDNTIEE